MRKLLIKNWSYPHASIIHVPLMAPHCPFSVPPPSSSYPASYFTSSNRLSSSVLLQRASADAQYRVVGEAEDLSGAALWLHCRGSERPRGDWSRGVWLRQQDGPQTHRPDHGCQGDLLIDTPQTAKLSVSWKCRRCYLCLKGQETQ